MNEEKQQNAEGSDADTTANTNQPTDPVVESDATKSATASDSSVEEAATPDVEAVSSDSATSDSVEAAAADKTEQETATTSHKVPVKNIAIGIGVAVLVLGSLLFFTEMSGYTNFGIVSGSENEQLENTVIANVSGTEITEYELRVSTDQQLAAAAAQGIDVTDPSVRDSIEEQAVTLLVNTTLLISEAEDRGLSVSDDEVATRYDTLVSEVGGEEALMGRMEEFGVTSDVLQSDIRDELVIQKLLDQLFADTDITVTEEEVQEVYTTAGGEAAGLPPLAEVEPQINAQLTAQKEQELVNNFVDELRQDAEIELFI